MPKPTYVVIERSADGGDEFIHEAFEATDDAAAIAKALAKWGRIPFDLVRSESASKPSDSVYAHPPTDGHSH